MKKLILIFPFLMFGQQVDWNDIKNKPTNLQPPYNYNTDLINKPFNFVPFTAQTPGGSLIIGSNTVTIAPVPTGVNGTNANYYVYISGGIGTAEACLVTGGTATSDSASGTLIFTCANTHSGAWTIQSATDSITERIEYSRIYGGCAELPAGTYNLYATITIDFGACIDGSILQKSLLVYSGTGNAISVTGGGAISDFRLRNFTLTGPGTGGSTKGIYINSGWFGELTNVKVTNFNIGLDTNNMLVTKINRGKFWANSVNIHLGGSSNANNFNDVSIQTATSYCVLIDGTGGGNTFRGGDIQSCGAAPAVLIKTAVNVFESIWFETNVNPHIQVASAIASDGNRFLNNTFVDGTIAIKLTNGNSAYILDNWIPVQQIVIDATSSANYIGKQAYFLTANLVDNGASTIYMHDLPSCNATTQKSVIVNGRMTCQTDQTGGGGGSFSGTNRLQYYDGASILPVDATWDSTNKRFVFGAQDTTNVNAFQFTRDTLNILGVATYNDTDNSGIIAQRARGTRASPTVTQNGDTLGFIGFGSWLSAGTGYNGFFHSAGFQAKATENHDATHGGTKLEFTTTPLGSVTRTVICTMYDDGTVSCPGGYSAGDGTVAGRVTLKELVANGNNFFRIKGPDSLAADVTIEMPNTAPSDQVLKCAPPSAGVSICTWFTLSGGGDVFLAGNNTYTGTNDFTNGVLIIPSSASPATTYGRIYMNTVSNLPCIADGTACRQLLTSGLQQLVGAKNMIASTVVFVDVSDNTKVTKFDNSAQATGTTLKLKTYAQTNQTVHVPNGDFVIPHKLTCVGGAGASEANTNTTTRVWANNCTIPASTLVTGVVITVEAGFNINTPNPNTSEGLQLCLRAAGTTIYCMAANQVPTANLTNRGGYARFILEGTAAASASSAVNVAGMIFFPGLAAAALDNALGAYAFNLATNASITLDMVITYAGTTSGNSNVRLTHFQAHQLN